MSEIGERARELAEKVYTYHMDDVSDVCELDIGNLREWFEQALLGERRLAMEEAAKMCMEGYDDWSNTLSGHYRQSEKLAARIRAAIGSSQTTDFNGYNEPAEER